MRPCKKARLTSNMAILLEVFPSLPLEAVSDTTKRLAINGGVAAKMSSRLLPLANSCATRRAFILPPLRESSHRVPTTFPFAVTWDRLAYSYTSFP